MKKTIIILAGLLLLPSFIFGEAEDNSVPPPIGVIFNIGNVLEGIESYQGGIGIKYIKDQARWRFLTDLYYDYGSNLFSSTLGAAREYHLRQGRVSPFLGWELTSGFTYNKDDTLGITETSVPAQIAALFGIEWYLNEFISLSAEYSIGVEYTFTYYSSTGTEDEIENSLLVNTGLGNNGKIGLTIYLNDMITIDEKE